MPIPLSTKQLNVLSQLRNQVNAVQAQLDMALDMIVESYPNKDKIAKITKIDKDGIHYIEVMKEEKKPELVKE